MTDTTILGAGVTGLAAGLASGGEVFEMKDVPGGICSSYYLRVGAPGRSAHRVAPDSFRFELGGGHWIFDGEESVLTLLRSFADLERYSRRSAVFIPELDVIVPYPLQNHLRYLPAAIRHRALSEILGAGEVRAATMREWLLQTFGQTLCELFFDPFHELYTAGLWTDIAPQDAYKSPIDPKMVVQGATGEPEPAGYNRSFIYPRLGLDVLVGEFARRARVSYGKRVVGVRTTSRHVMFADGSAVRYERLLSTLPLTDAVAVAGCKPASRADPAPGVLVLNIAGTKGERCPTEHWVYVPRSKARFHRVGFYSNVDRGFLPAGADGNLASLYVERAFPPGLTPTAVEIEEFSARVLAELRQWRWLREVYVVDPTWIPVAYTWSWAGSTWKDEALAALSDVGVIQVGRFATWSFQGIAESIAHGMAAGAARRVS